MSLFSWFEAEPKVGVSDTQKFVADICKLDPAGQTKMLEDMGKISKDKHVTADADGSLNFPGQFTLGVVGGEASGNHFNVGYAGSNKQIEIRDAHKNETVIRCPYDAASPSQDTKLAIPTKPPSAGDVASNSEAVDAALRLVGIDPKTLKPLDSSAATQPEAAGSRVDIGLPDKSHVYLDHTGGGETKVTAPPDVKVTKEGPGGVEIQYGGNTLHEKNGGVTSNKDVSGLTITVGH
jgi:hypothetical protein